MPPDHSPFPAGLLKVNSPSPRDSHLLDFPSQHTIHFPQPRHKSHCNFQSSINTLPSPTLSSYNQYLINSSKCLPKPQQSQRPASMLRTKVDRAPIYPPRRVAVACTSSWSHNSSAHHTYAFIAMISDAIINLKEVSIRASPIHDKNSTNISFTAQRL